MRDSEMAEYIRSELKRIEPRLTAKSRWLWGYHDALEDMLKKAEEENGNTGAKHRKHN